EQRRRVSHRVGRRGRDGGAPGGGRNRMPEQGPGARGDRQRDQAGSREPHVDLNAGNTAIVLDSTADFPDAAERFPNWRVVPLYVNFGTESFRDGVDLTAAEFYARLPSAETLPTTSQPTPADFRAVYEELGVYDRILSLHIAANLSGTFQSAGLAADDRVRTIDTETASVAITMLALAIQRRLDQGTTDEEIDALVERYKADHG